jgi:hypothetical protein
MPCSPEGEIVDLFLCGGEGVETAVPFVTSIAVEEKE